MGIFLLGLVLLFFTAILMSYVRAEVHTLYRHEAIGLVIRFWGIPVYRFLYCVFFSHGFLPRVIRIERGKLTWLFPGRYNRNRRRGLWTQLSDCVLRLEARLYLGTGDAAQTALLCGVGQQAIDLFIRKYAVHNSDIRLCPDYDTVGIRTEIHGIFRVRMTKIIGIILKEKRREYASD